MKSARQQVVDAIETALPTSWKVVPYLSAPDTIDRTTITIHATGISRFEPQPRLFQIEFEAVVLDPMKDPSRVWDALDDEVLKAITALDAIENLLFTNAEPVVVGNNFGWTITFTVPFLPNELSED